VKFNLVGLERLINTYTLQSEPGYFVRVNAEILLKFEIYQYFIIAYIE